MSEELFSEGYLIKQAGSKAAKDLLIGSLIEKVAHTRIAHDQYGVLNAGSQLLSDLHNPKDIQIALNAIEYHYDSGREDAYDVGEPGKAVAVFILRCPENAVYGNKNALNNWPNFFEDVLGFGKRIAKMDAKSIADGKDWYANFRDVLNFEHSNKTFDYFEVAVPLAGLLEKLGIDAEVYAALVKQAEENEAHDKGYVLAGERAPHSLGGLKKIGGTAASQDLAADADGARPGLFGKFKKLFG